MLISTRGKTSTSVSTQSTDSIIRWTSKSTKPSQLTSSAQDRLISLNGRRAAAGRQNRIPSHSPSFIASERKNRTFLLAATMSEQQQEEEQQQEQRILNRGSTAIELELRIAASLTAAITERVARRRCEGHGGLSGGV